jgi:DNA-binding PadR family transcriptional regulator
MSNTSKNFDFRELASDLIGLVKDRTKDVASSTAKPDDNRVQAAVLSAISETPKNASEIKRLISLASAGAWNPSSGEIQKALTTLESDKSLTAKLEGDRKVFSITKAGKAKLKSAAAETTEANTDESKPKMKLSGFPDLADLTGINCSPEFLRAASKLAPAMIDLAKTGSKTQQAAAAALLDETRHKLHVILAEK